MSFPRAQSSYGAFDGRVCKALCLLSSVQKKGGTPSRSASQVWEEAGRVLAERWTGFGKNGSRQLGCFFWMLT